MNSVFDPVVSTVTTLGIFALLGYSAFSIMLLRTHNANRREDEYDV